MIFVPEYYIYYLWYLAILIWSTVDIVHKYGLLQELVGVKTMLFYKTSVDENSSSFEVNQYIYRELFRSIGSLKRDREV